MRPPVLAILAAAVNLAGPAAGADSVLLASRRGGWIEAISPETLATISRIRAPEGVENVASDGSGTRLFLTAAGRPGGACCALFALDTESMELTPLLYPAQSATVTANRLFTQRGNIGIEVFDPATLSRLPTIKAPGIYAFRPSPEGRLMLGMTNWPTQSLDLFDTLEGALIDRQPVPDAVAVSGAWSGSRFFVLAVNSAEATLRTVDFSSGRFRQPALSSPVGSFPACEPAAYDVLASGGELVIYAQLGLKSDGRCAASTAGFLSYDPASGAMSNRFASDMSFRRLLASPDGLYLYGLDVGSPAWQRVRIVKIDARTRQVTAQKSLDPDVWYLTMGAISPAMRGRMDLPLTPAPSGPGR